MLYDLGNTKAYYTAKIENHTFQKQLYDLQPFTFYIMSSFRKLPTKL